MDTNYKTENSLKETFEDRIDKVFSDHNNVKKLATIIRDYADKHSDILLSTDMSTRLIFRDEDKNAVLNLCGIKQDEITEAISHSSVIEPSWIKATNPFYIVCVLLMRHFALKGNKDMQDTVTIYMSYVLYISATYVSFKYLPNKQIMDYTINNLSNRFIIKQEGTIQGMIERTVISAMDKRYQDELTRGSDTDIKDIISALDTRISSAVKNIATEFYKNSANKKYLNYESDNLSEDDFHISDNVSYKIERLTSLTTSAIVSEGFDRQNCINRAIKLNPGVSDKKLTAMLDTITKDAIGSINEMISLILTLFIYKGVDNTIDKVKSMKFVSESLQIYKSNAQDDITLKIKEILLKWIDMTSDKYGRNFISHGKTSLDNYRRAIYTCFVFKILECAN